MNNMYDILEICLQELEKGADLDALLARYPEHASELRPILKAAIAARSIAAPAPSEDAIRRGRAKLLQRAAELREEKVAPVRKANQRVIPMFQRLAITFSLTAAFLASGTGLVGASSTALPGENLYPVKRTWEDVRLFFTFDTNQRELLSSEFESERLQEANELIAEGRHETIQFSGVFTEVNGKPYVSGIAVLITGNTQMPNGMIQTGAAVTVTGHTNSNGFVELENIQLLPDGAVVPTGKPVEVESSESSVDTSSEGNTNSGESTSGVGGEAQGTQQSNQESNPSKDSFKLDGKIDVFSNNSITVNGQVIYLDANTKIEGNLKPGSIVEVEGYYNKDGKFIIQTIKVDESKSNNGNSSGSGGDNNGDNGSGGSGGDSGGSGGDSGGSDDHGGSSGGGGDGGGSGGGGDG
ncbi:MAG: DUF5666 domain-containing protein [Anaerolineales bacterium]